MTRFEGIGFGCGLGSLGRREEERAVGILTELMDQDAKAARGVAETASHLDAGNTSDEERAKGLVLAVDSVGGLEEGPGDVSYFIGLTGKHAPQLSLWGDLVKAKEENRENREETGENEMISEAGSENSQWESVHR